MRNPVIIIKKLPALGMAIFPFILLKDESLKNNPIIINHEKIHLRQQIELLIFPFYIFYLINYIFNRLRYKTHDEAYRKIVFEQEAYSNDSNLDYLNNRKWFAWAIKEKN